MTDTSRRTPPDRSPPSMKRIERSSTDRAALAVSMLALLGATRLGDAQPIRRPAHIRALPTSAVSVARRLQTRSDAVVVRVKPDGRNEPVPAPPDSASLAPGEVLVSRVPGVPVVDRSRAVPHLDLPIRVVAVSDRGYRVTLRLTMECQGMFYVPSDHAFVGLVALALEDSSHQQASERLRSRVLVWVETEGDRQIRTVALDHVGAPLDTVRVRSRSTEGDSLLVRVYAPGAHAIVLPLPVHRPSVDVTVAQAALDGFGLESTTLTVALSPGTSTAFEPVTVRDRLGTPDSSLLRVSDLEPVDTRIRSGRPGVDTVLVASDPLRPSQVVLTYRFPWLFAVAAATGGVIGVLLRRSPDGVGLRTRLGSSLGLEITWGLATAIAVAVCYATAVNLTGAEVPMVVSSAVAFAASMLVAFAPPAASPTKEII